MSDSNADTSRTDFRTFYKNNQAVVNTLAVGGAAVGAMSILQTQLVDTVMLVILAVHSLNELIADKTDDTLEKYATLLKRFVVYVSYFVIEFLFSLMGSFLPFSFLYPIIKLVFYFWLISDPTKAVELYDKFIFPFFNQNKAMLQSITTKIEELATTVSSSTDGVLTNIFGQLGDNAVMSTLMKSFSPGALAHALFRAQEALDQAEEQKTD